jgi:hypothetical protein
LMMRLSPHHQPKIAFFPKIVITSGHSPAGNNNFRGLFRAG